MRCSLLASFALVAFLALLSPTSADDPKQNKKGPVGQSAGELNLSDLKGKQFKLADMKGKVVLIDFFATWCGPCNKAMPEIVSLNAKYKKEGLVTIALNSEPRGDTADAVKKFVAKHKVDFPVAMLGGDLKKKLPSKLELKGYPHFAIIDGSGTIRYVQSGFDLATIERTVKDLLKETKKAG